MLLAANGSAGGSLGVWLPLLLLLAVAYFLLIRPQQRRRREAESLQSALGPGDEIVTVAGLYGKVVAVDDKIVTIEVAPGVTNRYARQAIGQIVNSVSRPTPKTTAKDVVDPD